MLKKIFYVIIISIFIQNCDYEPIYSKNEKFAFTITELEFSGDKDINNYLRKNLNKFTKVNTDKKFSLSIDTSFSKSSLAKNKSGNTTDYKLTLGLNLKLKHQEKGKNEMKHEEIYFTENFIITKNDSTFEQTNYENLMKNNLTEILLNRVIIYLKTK